MPFRALVDTIVGHNRSLVFRPEILSRSAGRYTPVGGPNSSLVLEDRILLDRASLFYKKGVRMAEDLESPKKPKELI